MRVKILTAFLFLYSCAGFLANADKDERNYCVAQLNNIIENFGVSSSLNDNESALIHFRDKTMTNESWKFSEKLSSPTTIYLDLSFDRLPKKEK